MLCRILYCCAECRYAECRSAECRGAEYGRDCNSLVETSSSSGSVAVVHHDGHPLAVGQYELVLPVRSSKLCLPASVTIRRNKLGRFVTMKVLLELSSTCWAPVACT
jgi:hypothetical protein